MNLGNTEWQRVYGADIWRIIPVRIGSLQLWGLSSFGRTSALQAEEAGSKPAVLHFICLRRSIGQDWVASNHLMRVRVVPGMLWLWQNRLCSGL